MARGPAYPFCNLSTAVGILEKLYAFAKRSPAAVSVVAKDAWGWSATSSTPVKAIAALRYFGLIEEIAGDQKRIKVSDRGYRILVDDPASVEHKKALQDAALSPAPYQWVYTQWGVEVPPAARSALIFERGFVASTVDGFLRDYAATMKYAGLEGKGLPTENDEGNAANDGVNSVVSSAQQPSGSIPPNIVMPSTNRTTVEATVMRQDVFSVEEGAVRIEWPAVLSDDSLKDIEDWLQIVKRKIARSLKAKDQSEGQAK